MPCPVVKPTSIDPSSRTPTDDSGSIASRTVEVVGPDVLTRPTSPSPLSTVMSGRTPSRVPASIVTVHENVCAAPDRDHLRGHDLVATGRRPA